MSNQNSSRIANKSSSIVNAIWKKMTTAPPTPPVDYIDDHERHVTKKRRTRGTVARIVIAVLLVLLVGAGVTVYVLVRKDILLITEDAYIRDCVRTIRKSVLDKGTNVSASIDAVLESYDRFAPEPLVAVYDACLRDAAKSPMDHQAKRAWCHKLRDMTLEYAHKRTLAMGQHLKADPTNARSVMNAAEGKSDESTLRYRFAKADLEAPPALSSSAAASTIESIRRLHLKDDDWSRLRALARDQRELLLTWLDTQVRPTFVYKLQYLEDLKAALGVDPRKPSTLHLHSKIERARKNVAVMLDMAQLRRHLHL